MELVYMYDSESYSERIEGWTTEYSVARSPLKNAVVVEWYTRMFQVHVSQDLGVRVPSTVI